MRRRCRGSVGITRRFRSRPGIALAANCVWKELSSRSPYSIKRRFHGHLPHPRASSKIGRCSCWPCRLPTRAGVYLYCGFRRLLHALLRDRATWQRLLWVSRHQMKSEYPSQLIPISLSHSIKIKRICIQKAPLGRTRVGKREDDAMHRMRRGGNSTDVISGVVSGLGVLRQPTSQTARTQQGAR